MIVREETVRGSRIIMGDCLAVMRGMSDNSFDACVTDPPAAISMMDIPFDVFQGRDHFVGWLTERLCEALRLTRPGGALLCWSLPKTSHWTGTAIENAGWTIDDKISHIFATGWPKNKRKIKPSIEEWWVAFKPGGKAAYNVEECRIPLLDGEELGDERDGPLDPSGENWRFHRVPRDKTLGRHPSNVALSHHEQCVEVGTHTVRGDKRAGGEGRRPGGFGNVGADKGDPRPNGRCYGDENGRETVTTWACHPQCSVAELERQAPGASRFFFCAKPSSAERGEGNDHPCVKSIRFMRHILRLAVPRDGTVLDPFLGSGSTLLACLQEGFRCVGIEKEPPYWRIAVDRAESEVGV